MDDETFLKPIQETDSLATISKKNYLSRARMLGNLFDTSLENILLHPENFARRLKAIYANEKTRKGYFTLITTLFKFNPDFKEKHEDKYKTWMQELGISHEQIEKDVVNNTPSEKQIAGYVPFDEFKNRITTLPRSGMDRLIIALYSMIPPVRADFNQVRIYKSKVPEDAEKNYLHITKRFVRLVLGEYKTAKTMGVIDEQMPPELAKEIIKNLDDYPRDWLFTDGHGRPLTANAYTKMVNRRLKMMFNRPLTISILRHSYINSLDQNSLTTAEKDRIARFMGHNMLQQDRYRLFFDKKKEEEDTKEDA